MSLRDELLKVGLINKKQAEDAERKQQRQERHPPRQAQTRPGKSAAKAPPRPAGTAAGTAPDAAPPSSPAPVATPPRLSPANAAAAAKLARDMELNRKVQEKAEKKARSAQVAQLIKQHRLAPAEGEESYNFVDGAKIRRVTVTPAMRRGLLSGELTIVRHEDRYDLIPASLVERLRERDPHVFIAGIAADGAKPSPGDAAAYAEFPVPDDLQW